MQPEENPQTPQNQPQQPAPQPQQPPNPVQSTPVAQPVQQDKTNPLSAMQAGESVICDIKRHPIGLLGNYLLSGTIIVLAAIGGLFLLPKYAPDSIHSQALVYGVIGLLFVAFFVFVFSYIAAKVYKGNRWIVTDDSITQVRQITLFNKQSSQLSLHNLEDITVDQNGIIQGIFNFGTLHAETAGERSKFAFPFCPNPNSCAREILTAREKFMGGGSFQGKVSNQGFPPHSQGDDSPDDPGININTNS